MVIIFQENRTVDNLFNGFPGADTVRSGLNSSGHRVTLHQISLTAPYDLGHTHRAFETEYADGKLDGFDRDNSRCFSLNLCAPADIRAYGFVPRNEAEPYFVMAERYAFGDRMFQTNQGPSFPAHQYIVSGTSTIVNGSSLRAADNPFTLSNGPTGGCDSPSGSLVALINDAGKERQFIYPCFNRVALMDLLEAKSLTWRYYQAATGPGLWNGPDAILHVRRSREFATDVVTPSAQVLKDVANGKLADVTWVTPTGLASDHALATNGSGPSWVAAVVNTIGKSRYWNDTAILVTWDDWGGWYDHVKPPQYNSYELSFRVPLIVISPYAKSHYVSHVQHEFGSILKFVEEIFGLPSMHTTDQRADDLFDCFDFSQSPRKFEPIPAPLPPKYFFKQPFGENPDDDSDYTMLYSFGAKDDDGEAPVARLAPVGGSLYGTTRSGGLSGSGCAVGCGTIYSIGADGGERILYRFKGGADGVAPVAGLFNRAETLFGTTSAGGSYAKCSSGCGTIFKTSLDGRNEEVLYRFGGGSDGANPLDGLVENNGVFYGTTQHGGMRTALCSNGCGTVFRIDADGKSERVLYAFKGGSDGEQPVGGLIEIGGALYGTTQYGGAQTPFCAIGCGTVFKVDPVSGAHRVLHPFEFGPHVSDGAYPAGRLLDAAGTIYGTTAGGGAASQGTIFRLDLAGTERVIHSFSCCKPAVDGTNPVDGLTLFDGIFYGTTRHGGAQGRGTIFSVTPSGAENVVYSFDDRPDGAEPAASLQALDGALFGSALDGGSASQGMVFRYRP